VKANILLPIQPEPKELKDLPKYVDGQAHMIGEAVSQLQFLINGQLSFGDGTVTDNILGVWIKYTTSGAEDILVHNLGGIPVGFLLVKPPLNGVINTGPSAWTTSTISLKSSVAGQTVTIFVLNPPNQQV